MGCAAMMAWPDLSQQVRKRRPKKKAVPNAAATQLREWAGKIPGELKNRQSRGKIQYYR